MNNPNNTRRNTGLSRPSENKISNFPEFNTARRDAAASQRPTTAHVHPQPHLQPQSQPQPSAVPHVEVASATNSQTGKTAPQKDVPEKPLKIRKTPKKTKPPKKVNARPQKRERQISRERIQAEEERRRRINEEHEKLAEANKRIAETKNARRAEARAVIREKYGMIFKDSLGYFAIFICALLIICCVTGTVFLISMLGTTQKSETPERVSIHAGTGVAKYPYSYAYDGGIYFINFSDLAEFCSLTVSGDDSNLVYSIHGETISFDLPSRYARVNGNTVLLSAEIRMQGGKLWVPLDFVEEYFLGIDIDINDEPDDNGDPQLIITVSRITKEDIGDYEKISFLLKANNTLGGISDSSLPDEPITLPDDIPQYDFIKDLSSYYVYMSPADRDKYLVLINGSNRVDESYIPDDMIKVINAREGRDNLTLCRDAAKSLEALFIEMYATGYLEVSVNLAYRSYETQKTQYDIYLFNERYHYRYFFDDNKKWFSDTAFEVLGESYLQKNYIDLGKTVLSYDDGVKVTSSYSAFPGTGDHQTGLSCDLYISGYSGTKFAESEAYEWLLDNAHKFGFIFRFPQGKEKITGSDFEPAHLRFVGQYHAAVIHETGLCLEEYLSKIHAMPGNQ